MSSKISYTKNTAGNLLTPCPFGMGIDNIAKVNSFFCTECEFFQNRDINLQFVTCLNKEDSKMSTIKEKTKPTQVVGYYVGVEINGETSLPQKHESFDDAEIAAIDLKIALNGLLKVFVVEEIINYTSTMTEV